MTNISILKYAEDLLGDCINVSKKRLKSIESFEFSYSELDFVDAVANI